MISTLLGFLVALGPGSWDSQLEWHGDDVCPGGATDLETALVRHLGEAAEPERIEATLSLRDGGPAGLRLSLRMASHFGQEQHELAAIDCARLIDQAALLIAGVVDPFVTMADAVPSSAVLHHVVVPVQVPTRAIVVDPGPRSNVAPPLVEAEAEPSSSTDEIGEFGELIAVEPDEPVPITGAIGVAGTTFIGVFPQVGGGVELEGALERGPLRWQNGASGWFGGRVRSSETEVGMDLWALGFSSSLCGVPAVSRVRVPLCAVVGAGAMRARAVGTASPRAITQPWVWAGAEASLQVLARQDLAIALGIGAHALVVRPAWEISQPEVSWRLPPVMGLLRLTLEVRELGRKKSTSGRIESL